MFKSILKRLNGNLNSKASFYDDCSPLDYDFLDHELRSERFLMTANRQIETIGIIETVEDKKQYCNYLIDALVNELVGFYSFQSPISGVLGDFVDIPHILRSEVEPSIIQITNQKIFSFTWSYERFLRSMKDVEEHDYKSSAEMALGWYYRNLNFLVVHSHNHHVAAAMQNHQLDKVLVSAPTYIIGEPTCRIYATKDFRFANQYGIVINRASDPRFVFACLLAQFIYDGAEKSIQDYFVER